VRWETKRSFDGKLCREYSYQNLSKSDNWFSSYSQKCRGCFFETRVSAFLCVVLLLGFLADDSAPFRHDNADGDVVDG